MDSALTKRELLTCPAAGQSHLLRGWPACVGNALLTKTSYRCVEERACY
jgi:hypothetical protein